jgi:cell division protein FtsL
MQLTHSLWMNPTRLHHQQALTKADRVKNKWAVQLIGLMVIAFICALFYIGSRIQVVNVGYEINRELALKERLLEENKRLVLEVATLKSPVRLEALAKNEYQMDLPQRSQILNQADTKMLEVVAQAPRENHVTPNIKTNVRSAQSVKKPVPIKVAVKKQPSFDQKGQVLKKEKVLSQTSKQSSNTKVATAAIMNSPR